MVRSLALLGLAVLVAACGSEEEAGDRPLTCDAGTTPCGERCVDLRTDEASCGVCGVVCPTGDACTAGACRRACTTQRFRLEEAVVLPVGRTPSAATAADADGDGLAELAVADSAGGIDVLPQTARGVFGEPHHLDEGVGTNVITAADLDEDGLPDLIVGELYEDRVLSLRATGDGTFTKRWIARIDAYVTGFATGDLDADGHLDIVATAEDEGEVILLRGTGTGEFAAFERAQFTNGPFAPAIGDFDGDGRADVAFGTRGTPFPVVLYRRDEGYDPELLDAVELVVGLAAGDFDADGLDDLAVSGANGVHVLLGRPEGPFERLAPVAGAAGYAWLRAGDLDGDGRAEVVAQGSGKLQVIRVEGAVAAVHAETEGNVGGALALVDLDGDRALDLVGTISPGPADPIGQVVAVYSDCR